MHGKSLRSHIDLLRSKGFDVKQMEVYLERGMISLQNKTPGIDIEPVGVEDHIPKVDAVIRRIKEMARSVVSRLPYSLPQSKAEALVTYTVSKKNKMRITVLNNNLCIKVRLTRK